MAGVRFQVSGPSFEASVTKYTRAVGCCRFYDTLRELELEKPVTDDNELRLKDG